jgi:hypothetical protein
MNNLIRNWCGITVLEFSTKIIPQLFHFGYKCFYPRTKLSFSLILFTLFLIKYDFKF